MHLPPSYSQNCVRRKDFCKRMHIASFPARRAVAVTTIQNGAFIYRTPAGPSPTSLGVRGAPPQLGISLVSLSLWLESMHCEIPLPAHRVSHTLTGEVREPKCKHFLELCSRADFRAPQAFGSECLLLKNLVGRCKQRRVEAWRILSMRLLVAPR